METIFADIDSERRQHLFGSLFKSTLCMQAHLSREAIRYRPTLVNKIEEGTLISGTGSLALGPTQVPSLNCRGCDPDKLKHHAASGKIQGPTALAPTLLLSRRGGCCGFCRSIDCLTQTVGA